MIPSHSHSISTSLRKRWRASQVVHNKLHRPRRLESPSQTFSPRYFFVIQHPMLTSNGLQSSARNSLLHALRCVPFRPWLYGPASLAAVTTPSCRVADRRFPIGCIPPILCASFFPTENVYPATMTTICRWGPNGVSPPGFTRHPHPRCAVSFRLVF